MANEVRKSEKRDGGGRGGRQGGGRGGSGGGNNSQAANLANANTGTIAPMYNSIFGGFAYCCKAAVNGRIRQVNGVWIKDCGATHHRHHDKSIITDYHQLKNRLYVGGIGSGVLAIGIGNISITIQTATYASSKAFSTSPSSSAASWP